MIRLLAVFSIFVFFSGFQMALAESEADIEFAAVPETNEMVYHDPGKWQLEPEKGIFFSINGVVNPRYFSGEINQEEPPVSNYLENDDFESLAAFYQEKSLIKKGMQALMLTATATIPVEISEFYFEMMNSAFCFKFPENSGEENQPSLLVTAEKAPSVQVVALAAADLPEAEARLRQFFAADKNFIPVTASNAAAQNLTGPELEKFIADHLKIKKITGLSEAGFEKVRFVRGGFSVTEEYDEEFTAVFLADGSCKVLPNYTLYSTFKVNGSLYFWGIWNYPETGWCDFQIFKFAAGGLTQVFTDSSFSN